MTTIDQFTGDHDFLSNFHPSPIEVDGVLYPTVEHAFQAAKTFDATENRGRVDQMTVELVGFVVGSSETNVDVH